MNITILSVEITTTPTKNGSFQTANVAYKNNSFGGKVEGKKVVSFGNTAESFKTLALAQTGDVFDVEVVKNQSGFLDWVAVAKSNAPAEVTLAQRGTVLGTGTKNAPRSSFETPEERAQRQVLIVRQSSINSAISALTPGAKASLKFDDVIAYAKQVEDYVFDRKSPGASGFEDLPDFDLPKFPDVK